MMPTTAAAALGATQLSDGTTEFLVWAPAAELVTLEIEAPANRSLAMERCDRGYHHLVVDDAPAGTRYRYRLDGGPGRPDPASRFQPEGVHGPSEVVSTHVTWQDHGWQGLPLESHILYELHVGTFTAEGTFDAIVPVLDELKELGVTAIEIMPVAQFPGARNWGYDGVYPYAAQNSYGGPAGLKRLVDACHARGLAIVLDVVYNHLGPEGNYLGDFGPYFTDRYRTAWGAALNFDGADSDEVRRFFVENALMWITEYHMDGLRLDAVDAIIDHSARPFLQDLAEAIHTRAGELGRSVHTFAESALNDPRLVLPPEKGGLGHDAQWNDEFHHALHALLTGERAGYYQDFGRVDQLAKAYREGYVYSGQYSSHRRHRLGTSSKELAGRQFVVFRQNHDQVGNRLYGRRLGRLTSFEGVKLSAAAVLLSPYLPLLFMGEEYGETAPFLYFTSHSDPELIEAVRRGRQEEFAGFDWPEEPPDPQDDSTFLQSNLDRSLAGGGSHRALAQLYRALIKLRNERPALRTLSKEQLDVSTDDTTNSLVLRRWHEGDEIAALLNFSTTEQNVPALLASGRWLRLLCTSDECWHGPGSSAPDTIETGGQLEINMAPLSVAVYGKAP